MTTHADIPPDEWDREARLLGRLSMIEKVIGSLIRVSGESEQIKHAIETQLDFQFGRNPPAKLNKVSQEIAYGAQASAEYFLKVCELQAPRE
ncbi:MAG: hypothetical protein PGN20_07760 [Agrobacterium cavarae]